jgi:hypothetical protein
MIATDMKMLFGAGIFTARQGALAKGATLMEQSLVLAREPGASRMKRRALNDLDNVAADEGETERAALH